MAKFGRITYKENLELFHFLSSALEVAGFRNPVRDIRDFNLSDCRKLKLNEVRVISNDDIFI
jgi:Zn-finger domain-containing protein